ncbi:hypothetical protein [Ruania zhangjianzhongii]|uniref:hypothetical protein n=1 Tax=Ruania zhangjianzhongii TaxID=2603206 RepID=UPI0011C9DA31|nr:hypothetical protein [Ruania zhangjianzhongii]
MSQIPPGPSAGRAFTRFLIGFALVEGALLSAIMLAMVFEIITVGQMIPMIMVIALAGCAALTWRVLTLNKHKQRETSAYATQVPQSGPAQGYGDSAGLNDLGQQDPMAKYRDPNR